MTEKDLYKYKYAVGEERRRRQALMEHETRLNAIRLSTTPTTPGGGSSDTSGKIAADIERVDRCRAKLKEAIEEVSVAELMLEAARKRLDEHERAVFDALYYGYINIAGERVFCTIYEASKRLRYSQSNVYKLRSKILNKLSPVAV